MQSIMTFRPCLNCCSMAAGETLQRSAEPPLHPGPGQQGARPSHGPPLRLRPHLLQVNVTDHFCAFSVFVFFKVSIDSPPISFSL